MSFLESVSPGVKRYVIFVVALFGLLLIFRQCTGPSVAGGSRARGVTHQPQ